MLDNWLGLIVKIRNIRLKKIKKTSFMVILYRLRIIVPDILFDVLDIPDILYKLRIDIPDISYNILFFYQCSGSTGQMVPD